LAIAAVPGALELVLAPIQLRAFQFARLRSTVMVTSLLGEYLKQFFFGSARLDTPRMMRITLSDV